MSRTGRESAKDRRKFIRTVGAAAGLVLVGCATRKPAKGESTAARAHSNAEHHEAEVTPGEDLMQEHGVLERILLVYDEAGRRIEDGAELDTGVVTRAAGIQRRFIEDYHEKLEEEFVFPRLRSAGRQAALVDILRRQHERGRALTDEILRRAEQGPSSELRALLGSFARMYRPHAAREDTVLFPAFREVVGRGGYRELGEQFEEKEHALFGEHGFQEVVDEVAELERALGIHDLASFTPA